MGEKCSETDTDSLGGSFIQNRKPGPWGQISPAVGGIAGIGASSFWSTKVYEITNPKHQITNKLQIPMSNDQNMFGTLLF